MHRIPSHHFPGIAIAVRIARVLAAVGLTGPATEVAADYDIMEWATEFSKDRGSFLSPDNLLGDGYYNDLKEFVYMKAANAGWIPAEVKALRCTRPDDFAFKEATWAAREVQDLPNSIPLSRSNQILLESVRKEFVCRALYNIKHTGCLDHPSVEISIERDGRSFVLRMDGIKIAQVVPLRGSLPTLDDWTACLRSNLTINFNHDTVHQKVVEINGRVVACTSCDVSVEVYDTSHDSAGKNSILSSFDSDRVIIDVIRKGDVVNIESTDYESLLDCSAPRLAPTNY